MKIDVKPFEEGVQRMTVHLDRDDYAQSVEEELKKLRKKVQMPGFRPGKVPVSLIRKQYGESVKAKVIQKMVSAKIDEYIKTNKLLLLSNIIPVNDSAWKEELNKENPEFIYEFAPVPEFSFPLEKLKDIKRYKVEVSDKSLEDYIQYQREVKGDWVKADKFEEGVIMFFDVKPKEGKEDKPVRLFATFNEVKDNEKALKILQKLAKGETYEATYKYVNGLLKLDGKAQDILEKLGIAPADKIILSMEAMEKNQPAELNAEFFNKVFLGDEIETLEQFREEIKNILKKTYINNERQYYFDRLTKRLMETVNIHWPKGHFRRLYRYNNPEITDKELDEILNEDYVKGVKFNAILDTYFRQYDVELTPGDIQKTAREKASQMLRQYGAFQMIQSEEQLDGLALKWMEESEDFASDVRFQARVNKFFEHLEQQLDVPYETISSDEFLKLLENQSEKQTAEQEA